MRRRATRTVLACVVLATFAACTSFDDAKDTPSPDAAAANDAGADVAVVTDGQVDGGEVPDAGDAGRSPFCTRNPGHRLCDDFDDLTLADPQWTASPATNVVSPNVIGIAERFVNSGDGLLRIRLPDGAANEGAAFMRHDVGKPAGTITFAFALNLTGFGPNDYVEVATLFAAGNASTKSVGIALQVDKLRLFMAGETAAILPVNPRTAGRFSVTVTTTTVTAFDGLGQKLAEIKAAPDFSNESDVRFSVGLSYTTGCAAGTIDIDDVTLDY